MKNKRRDISRREIRVLLSKKEVKRLIKAAKNDKDKQIITMLWGTGMRASELSDLKLDDIDVNTGEIRVKGRGGKVRVVKYPQENLGALEGWLNKRENNKCVGGNVFVSRSGEKLSLMQIRKIVHQASQRAGIRGITPHVIRHTFAYHAGNNDVNFEPVQRMMGFANPNTTMSYIKVPPERLLDSFEKFIQEPKRAGRFIPKKPKKKAEKRH